MEKHKLNKLNFANWALTRVLVLCILTSMATHATQSEIQEKINWKTRISMHIKRTVTTAKKYIKKPFDCLSGNDDTCTTNEIIGTRIAILALSIIFLITVNPVIMRKVAHFRATQRGIYWRNTREKSPNNYSHTTAQKHDSSQEPRCMVCLESKESRDWVVPSPCENKHNEPICKDCLDTERDHFSWQAMVKCPLCRASLIDVKGRNYNMHGQERYVEYGFY